LGQQAEIASAGNTPAYTKQSHQEEIGIAGNTPAETKYAQQGEFASGSNGVWAKDMGSTHPM
jgi:hypothetical protein